MSKPKYPSNFERYWNAVTSPESKHSDPNLLEILSDENQSTAQWRDSVKRLCWGFWVRGSSSGAADALIRSSK